METKLHTNNNTKEKAVEEEAKPKSSSSSPSHEFSFTISLHSSSTTLSDSDSIHNKNNTANKNPNPSSFAIDLSPADDIFFHGHLLPLQFLSHLPVSPRTSINSVDSFTLPIRELTDDHQKPVINSSIRKHKSDSNIIINSSNSNGDETKARTSTSKKPKSFSFFRWKKGCEIGEIDKQNQKKNLRFELSRVLKRYVSMVRPLLFFKGKTENMQFHNSFSGNLSLKNVKQDQFIRGRRRGEYSAPASMRTSPTNSGLLVATANLSSSTSDSTMEELQAAIQAAIAHCKNSIAAEDKIKC
ncbi:BRI1 kinase inhibitor 1 [Mercurialis annua]|uniref:BRI1 kinase inhibitor 1 n=1 Tax=Mercurialis annua TaxID=3986 RepID=UPI002160F503|nr:BRI1 kinase inhibitor 1 [Mercurialis annua]